MPSSVSGESGPYGELVRRGMPEGARAVFLPSLAALFEEAERLKGGQQTEAEELRIRGRAPTEVEPVDVAGATERDRGYPEVDPLDVWASWQALRTATTP